MLTLRLAREEDARFLLDLRNERAVRENSRHARRIGLARHRRWLRASLADPAHRRLYIVEVDGCRAGTARLDRWHGEMSLALVPTMRGRGLAPLVVLALIGRLRALGWGRLATATVRARNLPSVAAFTRAGFAVRALQRGPRGPWLSMERAL